MRKALFSIVVSLSVCASPFGEARAQLISLSCSRSTIASYPEAESAPLLRYLDGARATAELAMQLFAESRFTDLETVMSPSLAENPAAGTFERTRAQLEREQGRLMRYELSDQRLCYSPPWPIDLEGSSSVVWFAVETTNPASTYVFVTVHTRQEGDRHVLYNIKLEAYDDDTPPEWLDSAARPRRPICDQFPRRSDVETP